MRSDAETIDASHDVDTRPLPAHVTATFDNPRTRIGMIIPSSNTVSNAQELSRFAEIWRRGGELDGVRIMSSETLREATAERRRLRPDVATGLVPLRWGTGFMLGSKRFGPFGLDAPAAFGHTGLVNIAMFADPERELAVGVVSSGKPGGHKEAKRYPAVLDAIAAEVPRR